MGGESVPVLTDAARITLRRQADPILDPLGLMIRVSRLALADVGL